MKFIKQKLFSHTVWTNLLYFFNLSELNYYIYFYNIILYVYRYGWCKILVISKANADLRRLLQSIAEYLDFHSLSDLFW